jgi:predicted kinase
MARLHLVLGPVGAGKSTFATQLGERHGALRLTLDEWMATLFSPDRPATGLVEWYTERADRCIDQIWKLASRLIGMGSDVVLEIGLIQQQDRLRFYERVDDAGYELTIYVLDLPRDVRRERVLERNRKRGETFASEVPPHIFELASDMWQPLDDAECRGRDVRLIAS